MKNVIGLGDVLLNSANLNQRKEKVGNKVAFGDFMQQWRGKRVATPTDKTVLGKEEQKLLEQSLAHLLNFRLDLQSGANVDEKLTSEKLKKLLQKMGQDPDFLLGLNSEMKALLQKMLCQLKEPGELQTADLKKAEELAKFWNRHMDKKREKMMSEVEELITAIQERLALAGIQVKTQVVEKDGERTAQVSFSNTKNPDLRQNPDLGKMRSSQVSETKESVSILAKSLLNRISTFLSGTDGSVEKSALNAETLNLREAIKQHLKRENQPVGWRKEELIHRVQQSSLNEMNETQQKQALTQEAVTATVGKLIKEETKSTVMANGLLLEERDSTLMQEDDIFFNLISNVESTAREVKTTAQSILRENRTYQPQTEELFQQMVDKFRLDLKQGITQMEIKLYPEELGRLHLKLVVENGTLTAQFLTENTRVKELIEQNITQLRDAFTKEGITWEKITVDVDQQALAQNPFASQGQQNLKDNRNKRQNFADSFSEELRVGEANLKTSESAEEMVINKEKDPNRLVDYLV